MRKVFYLLLGLFLLDINAKAQDITLTTQAQVDAFNQTSVVGTLRVSGFISNLNGLSELQSVGLSLEIISTSIANIDALSNLQSIGHSLRVEGNSLLTNLNGFSSLTSVVRGIYFNNNSVLTNYDGLLSLTSNVEGIAVSACPIVNLNGFSSISGVTGFIELVDNPALVNLDGLESVQIIGVLNSLKINDNDVLQNIDGLTNVKDAGGIQIMENKILPNIDGLSNLETLASMIIENNSALTNIDGLSKIQSTAGSLFIRGNSALLNIDGLGNITVIGKELILGQVPNVGGLSKLTKVGTNLIIGPNPALVDLDGLESLLEVGNDIGITNNSHLVDFCGLYNLFHSGTIGGDVTIKNNGANTLSVTPPADIILYNDPDLCSRDISSVAPTVATVDGCLKPSAPGRSPYPAGNIFPVGTTNIVWSATDAAGNSATAVQHVTIIDNQLPAISCSSAVTVQCADDVPAANIGSVTASDNCPNVTVTHVNDVISNQICANKFTVTRTYKATDGSGNTAACTQTITVNDNTPPQITGLSASKQVLAPPNHKMVDVTLEYEVSDNCVGNPNYSISIGSNEPVNGTGDGDTDPDWEIIDDHHIRLRAERAATGSGRVYTITITASDGCNASVTSSVQVVVAHNITGPHSGQSFKAGSTVSFSGEFWDKPGNKHTSTWLIDDNNSVKGSVTEPSGNKNGKSTSSYKFANPGVYKLQMNIKDQNGVTTYANTNGDLEAIVVIYDPNGGYTYGGGYFNSPYGALASDPSATGKASYGFAMNYFKNSTYPKGETQFEFKVGDFEFNALNFDYLVINNSTAQFKGTGKIIGGQSGIGFTMTVVDGQLDGTGIDKIRMKIYNKNNGSIIYDNQFGASDAALPTQAVGTNSVIVINGANANITQSNATPKTEMEATTDVLNKLDVVAYPNPSANDFSVTVQTNAQEKIIMQVVDMYGRVIEIKNVNANSIVKFGDHYRPGTYFIRVMQGKEHKEIKLIKLSN